MDAPKITLGALTFEVPYLDAGALEDHEAEVRTFLALKPEIPVGKDMGAIVTLVLVLAQRAALSANVTREQIRAGINAANLGEVMRALAYAFGFTTKAVAPGEAASPSSST